MHDTPTAALVIIGAEILSGRTADTNSRFLARELHDLGVELRRIAVIPDDVDVIAAEVQALRKEHTFVLTSGGVGPTPDDVTIKGIAAALGRKVVRHPEIERVILAKYANDPVNAYRLNMADVPEGARLIDGTGHFLPIVAVENIYIFPGVPEILEAKFAVMREQFRSAPFLKKKVCVACYESAIVPHLAEVDRSFPKVKLGSYPAMRNPRYKVELTLESKDGEELERAYRRLLDLLPPSDVVEP